LLADFMGRHPAYPYLFPLLNLTIGKQTCKIPGWLSECAVPVMVLGFLHLGSCTSFDTDFQGTIIRVNKERYAQAEPVSFSSRNKELAGNWQSTKKESHEGEATVTIDPAKLIPHRSKCRPYPIRINREIS
jgi:hypothetical protein